MIKPNADQQRTIDAVRREGERVELSEPVSTSVYPEGTVIANLAVPPAAVGRSYAVTPSGVPHNRF